MKPLCLDEIVGLAEYLQKFKGYQLQKTFINDSCLILLLYKDHLVYLVVDLRASAPIVLGFDGRCPVAILKAKKPINLFLEKHFIGKKLNEVSLNEELGRALNISFGDCQLQISLFPQGKNITALAENKKIYLKKPKEIIMNEKVYTPDNIRSVDALRKEYLSATSIKSKKVTVDPQIENEEKKQKVLVRLRGDLIKKESLLWQEAGLYLQGQLGVNVEIVDVKFKKYVNLSLTRLENIENCFDRSKKNKVKIINLKQRIEEVSKNGLFAKAQVAKGTSSKEKEKLQGKTLNLSENNHFFVGKNAKENIKFLRGAKPWFYWVHLRDFPSCHGFLSRNKNENISKGLLDKAFRYLVEQNFKNKAKGKLGESFGVLVTECRYVKPIKGDKVGRVRYSNEKSYEYKYQG